MGRMFRLKRKHPSPLEWAVEQAQANVLGAALRVGDAYASRDRVIRKGRDGYATHEGYDIAIHAAGHRIRGAEEHVVSMARDFGALARKKTRTRKEKKP